MFPSLQKYRHAFSVGLQSNLVYRWNFAIRGFFSMFHLVVVVVLWSAAYAGQTDIGGFSLNETITYFVMLIVLQFFIAAFNEDYQISEEIRNGLINQFLLKPINYFGYRLSIYGAARLVSGSLVLIPLFLAMPLLKDYIQFPSDWEWRLALGLPALVLSALVQFSIAYCFGMLTFWFLEIQGFVILSMAIESVLGGQIFPLDLLPAWVLRIAEYLPFYYQMYFPAAIFTGRIDDPMHVVRGLGIELVWVIVLLSVNQLLWRRGLRRHTAVGG